MSSLSGCHQCLCPRASSSCPLLLQETLQDQQVVLTQSPFIWLLLLREIVCAFFNSGVFISHNPLSLLKVSPAGLQSQTFWGLALLRQDPRAGEPAVGLRPFSSLGRSSAVVIILPFVDCPARHMGLDYTSSVPFLPILLRFLPYIFGCGRAFLIGSSLFFVDSCSVILLFCNFSVPMRGGKLRLFLLCHLTIKSSSCFFTLLF